MRSGIKVIFIAAAFTLVGIGLAESLVPCAAEAASERLQFVQNAVGAVNCMRIGTDVDASWDGIQAPARATGLRSFYQSGAWFNDPDCLVVRPPLSLDEARVWTAIVALSGGMALLSDDLPRLPAVVGAHRLSERLGSGLG